MSIKNKHGQLHQDCPLGPTHPLTGSFPGAEGFAQKIALPAPVREFATQSANRGGLRMNVN
jgi:hypothetical protein